jgi:hypothetical protein
MALVRKHRRFVGSLATAHRITVTLLMSSPRRVGSVPSPRQGRVGTEDGKMGAAWTRYTSDDIPR